MSLFALSQDASDFYTVYGFGVGVVSFLVGVVAFVIALVQVRQARDAARASKSAAEAARDAANRTFAQDTSAYGKFVGAFTSRLLSELQRAVIAKEWKVAALRANDLAELLASLPPPNRPAAGSTDQLREYGLKFAECDAGLNPKIGGAKWKRLIDELDGLRDRLNTPFQEKPDEQPGRSAEAAPATDRPGAARED